ncbi:MAG: DUF3987 domain-containing protein [Acidimicrobiales bacterium]
MSAIDWDAARSNGLHPSEPAPWPVLHEVAHHGLAGRIVSELEPHSEADPAHMLLSLLTGFGAAVGREPHAQAGNAEHPARFFTVVVGKTSKSRKGTSWATVGRVLNAADSSFFRTQVLGGWGSGEAVVDAVRDRRGDDDEGVSDKRILIQEGEFARFLKVAARDGSILSMAARNAWDGIKLEARSRASTTVATEHHICLLGHVTVEELRARLTETDMANGFCNRMLFVLGHSSKRLPEGGNLDDEEVERLGSMVAAKLRTARTFGRLNRSAAGIERWAEMYHEMADDDPGGLVGAVTSRDQAQTLRLSVVYALLDSSRLIEPVHLEAAFAVWSYCRASAAYIFGDSLGDEVADRLHTALRQAGETGLDLTAQSAVFARNQSADRLKVARDHLERRGLARTVEVQTDGRPRTVTYTLTKKDECTKE